MVTLWWFNISMENCIEIVDIVPLNMEDLFIVMSIITRGIQRVNPFKFCLQIRFNHHFPMVFHIFFWMFTTIFLWFSYGFPMVFLWLLPNDDAASSLWALPTLSTVAGRAAQVLLTRSLRRGGWLSGNVLRFEKFAQQKTNDHMHI